ncbi:MAG: hypothetical protein ABIT08_10855, partial [Bacteroidia bacterium]
MFHKIFFVSTTLHTCSTRNLSSPRHLTRASQDIYRLHDTSHVLHKKFIISTTLHTCSTKY